MEQETNLRPTQKVKAPNKIKKLTNNWSRWLHIYLSMFSFVILFFFAITGITLNHTDWFADAQSTTTIKDSLQKEWVNVADSLRIPKLEIVEYLRKKHQTTGALSEFTIDEYQCTIAFSGPGYSADYFVDRETGKYDLTIMRTGLVGILNDLHKGRDSGKAWAWLIDISAVLMILVSLTGLLMLFFLKKKRVSGVLVILLGGLISYVVYKIWVP